MDLFTKRREKDEQFPRPVEAPQRVPANPAPPPHTTAAAPPASPRPAPAAERGATTIGPTVGIKGEVRSEEDLLIDGQLEGRLDMGRNRLVIGPNAKVRAAIVAREVDVHGVVNGNVEASERILLRKNSKLVGDLKMTSVVIEDGAYFKGSIDITRAQEAASTGPVIVPKSPALPTAS